MNSLLLSLLRLLARRIIAKHQPYIIGVTGTIGKTTMTSYIAHYLKCIYGEEAVWISPYHYNGEYGLPLTIMQAKSGGKNPLLWIRAFLCGMRTYFSSYPRYLVLEYGIDHPGEMEYLLSIVEPDLAILTSIAPNHLEQFGTFERYQQAKTLLIDHARQHAIVHESLRPLMTRKDVLYYGRSDESDAFVEEVSQETRGVQAEIQSKGHKRKFTLPSFGHYQAENILPLYLISYVMEVDDSVIAENTHLFVPEGGRSRLLTGKNGTTIIDGSYNGGYESICRGIDSLVPFLTTHRIICFLGDMRELGDHAEATHKKLGNYIIEKLAGKGEIHLFLVGPLMGEYIVPMLEEKFPLSHSLSSRDLGKKIGELLDEKKPTLIYVKGSQNTIFLEEGIKEFLANPADRTLLCRQSEDWMKKKEKLFAVKTK